ncbi:MAG: hypothetical protein ACI4VE_02195 [Clostridia bacterium]
MNKKNDKVYLKIDTRNVDRFATFVKLLYFFLILIIVVLIIGTLFLAGKTIYNYYHNIERRLNPNVLDELEDKYSKDFKIVDVSTDEDGFGVYTLYYKEDKNVIFNVVKDKTTRTIYDDFNYRYKKYYIENCNDANIKNNLRIKENYTEVNGCQILVEYEYWFEISSYNDIETATNNVYALYNYFLNNAKNPYILIVGGIIRQNNYVSNVSFEYGKDKQIFLKEMQNDYSKYF